MKTIFFSLMLIMCMQLQAQTKKPMVKPAATKSLASKQKKISVNALYLQATWDLMQSPSGDGMNMSQTWVFTKDEFTVEGYPELKQKGMYKILKEKGDTLFLKLYKQEGHWGTEDKEQKVVVNKTKDRMTIGPLEFRRKDK